MKKLVMFAAAFAISAPLYAQNVATVNGTTITQKQLDQFISLLVSQGAKESPELREQVKQEMIGRLVAVQAAERAGIDKNPEVRQELELARQGILVRALMENYLEENPVTDKQIEEEYEAIKKAQSDRQEYKIRHILVEDEQTARDLITKIDANEVTFEDAAKENSIDKGTGSQGGDLGWSTTSSYVPPFAQAVEGMEKGQRTSDPIKSQFGWHIIEVEDIRPVTFPTLAEVKPQLQEMLQQEKLSQYQEELMEKAKIQ
ncbi:MAG TPA: peptidylprolyl isomerase [Pusillimonas sp.]|nr:peptidylprolyl isomerase [Pusillimonas sp.]|tara:strand:+ start:32 stop:808 length:777 start_codon:yes stop_codon:yes gene_type:complete